MRKYVGMALFLAALSVSAAPVRAETPKAVQTQVQISDVNAAIRSAARNPIKVSTKNTYPKQDAFAVVYDGPDGRYAVLNYSAKDAPKGKPSVDGRLFDELKLKYIDSVDNSIIDAEVQDNGRFQSEQADNVNPPFNSANDVKVKPSGIKVNYNDDYPYHLDWWAEWRWRNWTDSNNYAQQSGDPTVGCENDTSNNGASCTLSASASGTVGVSSQLTLAKLINIGFNSGHTYTSSVSWTVNPVAPHSMYTLVPMGRWTHSNWNETRDEYACGTDYSWQWWCSNTPYVIQSQANLGAGDKPTGFYGRLIKESL